MKKNFDHKKKKRTESIKRPVQQEKRPELPELDPELDELADFEMADMESIREIVMLDPNDIEFRQRHAEVIETDSAA